jgi:FkbM family methyltransferase
LTSSFKKFIHKTLKQKGYELKPVNTLEKAYGKISYAQCGEDLIVQYIFSLRGIEMPSYIDVGANHPYFISNTALFYNKGCRGINIEANPHLHELFKQYRPQDINLNIGIADHEDELDFYVMKDDTLSTFSKAEYENLIAAGKELAAVKKVKLTTIETVLSQHYNNACPDFLSLDVEGMDYDILQSIDFTKYAPKVICVEAAEYSPIGAGARRNELIDFLVSKNYYEYANTNLNAIMVRKDFWFI